MSKKSNVRILGLNKKLANAITTEVPYLLDVNFGSTSHTQRPDSKILNSLEAVKITRDRCKVSEYLEIAQVPAFKCIEMDSFYQNGNFNLILFKDTIGFPFTLINDKISRTIKDGGTLLDIMGTEGILVATMRAEKRDNFDYVMILHVAPTLPLPDRLMFSSLMLKKDFFNRTRSRKFTDITNTSFMRPGNMTSIIFDACTAVKMLKLDFAEVDIAYDMENNHHSILDVKAHVRFDDAGVIAKLYSDKISSICSHKYGIKR